LHSPGLQAQLAPQLQELEPQFSWKFLISTEAIMMVVDEQLLEGLLLYTGV